MSIGSPEESFRQLVRQGALRWLHGIDLDRGSLTYGICDREYWAWKLKDFANGTCQAGLAGFLDSIILFDWTKAEISNLVMAVLTGTRTIQRADGSFEEAYPFESSYCVTALVQFALLYSRIRHPEFFTRQAQAILDEIIQGSDAFLARTPETHGVIANHLATGIMARHLAAHELNRLLPESEYAAFISLQHTVEGWFPEYGLADPGYQTLLNHYLAAANLAVPLPGTFDEVLKKSQAFVSAFALPDGTFGGEVGGRGTAICYPGGLSAPMWRWFLDCYASSLAAVTPVTVDVGNFVPVFNSWALALHHSTEIPTAPLLFLSDPVQLKAFPIAGLYRISAPRSALLFSARNGAIRKVVHCEEGWQDESLVGMTSERQTTQLGEVHNLVISEKAISWQVTGNVRLQPLNTPFATIVLRLMGLVLHPLPTVHRAFKKLLAHFVMGKQTTGNQAVVNGHIDLTQPDCPVSFDASSVWHPQVFGYHQHMASANTFERRALNAGN